jgi:hypothetical protein
MKMEFDPLKPFCMRCREALGEVDHVMEPEYLPGKVNIYLCNCGAVNSVVVLHEHVPGDTYYIDVDVSDRN